MAAALNCIEFHIDLCRCFQNGHQQPIGYFQTDSHSLSRPSKAVGNAIVELSIRLRVR